VKDSPGFTLLEVLVSITLIAILVVVLSMALRSGISSYTRAKERNTTFFPVAAFEGLLCRQLEAIVAPGMGDLSDFSFFDGSDDKLIFITTYGPLGIGRGGLMKVVYWFNDDDDAIYYAQKVVVRKKEVKEDLPDGFYSASIEELNKEGWTVAKLEGVKGLTFSYRGAKAQSSEDDFTPDKWEDKFSKSRSLPIEIGLRIDLEKDKDKETEAKEWVVLPVGIL